MSVARALLLAAILATAVTVPGNTLVRTSAATTIGILVTSTASTGGACPDTANCTLRAAIALANADASGVPVVISFAASVFQPTSPSSILISTPLLPPISRANVTIDGSNAGVRILWNGQDVSSTPDGIVLMGADNAVYGLEIGGFRGACVAARADRAIISGDPASGQGNLIGSCGMGIEVAGPGATVSGNRIGFTADNQASPVTTGILVVAPGAVVGGTTAAEGNVIGYTTTAIRVGGPGVAAFSGTTIGNNRMGRDPAGQPAQIATGVDLRQPSSGTTVVSNRIAYAGTGISVAADSGSVSVTGNRFQRNEFSSLAGLAIDLNADGVMNPNHDGNSGGANHLRNHPTFTRAVQSRINGTVGADCGGCEVQLYLADHRPGSPNDYGRILVAGGMTNADASGNFAFDNPAVTPGQWVTALVTDSQGNTSEFGPSTRVGAGVAQCGNLQLLPGWNHGGYFGPEPVVLGTAFPASGPDAGRVDAIYQYDSATGQYTHWISGSGVIPTLQTLEPGEAYWFLASGTVTLGTGFSLSVPLPVSLRPGWNDVVYIGATADIRDALASIAGKYRDVYRWDMAGDSPGWQVFGDGTEPPWASDFHDLEACSAYEILVTEAASLTPLQP
ncbi:MAG: hypothetical protein LC118_06280 [Dehalococcoidia bacterium]|nr:hypothetical protein [Dehalococcoidia bacterium]